MAQGIRSRSKSNILVFNISVLVLIMIAVFFLVVKRSDQARETVPLYNEKDLSGWEFQLKDPAVSPVTVFTSEEGMIRISGDPFGYMRTMAEYSNYELNLEWRWPKEAGNSGVFVHVSGENKIWPKCIECQLHAGDAGDFIMMGGTTIAEMTDPSEIRVPKYRESSENPVGQWNQYRILCKPDSIILYVNGILQNIGTRPGISSGSIGLQSEGAPIEFRNLQLKELED